VVEPQLHRKRVVEVMVVVLVQLVALQVHPTQVAVLVALAALLLQEQELLQDINLVVLVLL
jgi:hypothetical protein